MMNPTKFYAAIISMTAVFASDLHANVLGIFPAGPGCKSAAIESAGDCSEAQTLLYNPAVMSEVESGFAGEAGIGRLQYSYEHRDFDPVHINLLTPMFSEGWRGTSFNDRLSWGFAVAPASSADLNIKGLPRRVTTNAEPLNVRAERRSFHMPVGGSFTFPEHNLNVGAALVYTFDRRSLKAASVTAPDAQLISQKGDGHFFRPIIGARYHHGFLHFGTSYLFPLTKKFDGKTKLITANDQFKTELTEHDPAILLTNVQAEFGDFLASANINHIFAQKGANIYRDGVNRKTTKADLKDANQFGARIAYKLSEKESFSFGYAHMYSIWGDGKHYVDEEGFEQHQFGHAFGQFNAIPVRNQAISWRRSFERWQTNLALFRSAGTTTVGPGGDNPGFYQMEFISMSCGIRKLL